MRPAPDPIVGRIFANLAKLMSGKAGAGIISLVYMIIAARALGPADYGVLVLVHSFAMTVGGIVEFPGWHAIVRYGAEALEQRDRDRLGRLLRFAGAIEIVGGIAAVITAAILGPLLGERLGWSPAALAFALPYSLAVLASIRSTPAGYLQLTGRFDLLGWHTVAAPVVRLAGAAVAAALGAGLQGFLIAWLIAALVEWASLWLIGLWAARRALGDLPLGGSMRGVTQENEGIWRFMVGANVDTTISELSVRVVPLIVGATLGPVAAGFYALAQRITSVLAAPAMVLGQSAYAELARLVAVGGDGRALRRTLLKSGLIAICAALPVVILLLLFAREVTVAVGGEAYAGAAVLMMWLAVARLVTLMVPPTRSALVALGRPFLAVAANFGAAVVALPLLPLLLMRFGLGAAGWQAVLQGAVTLGLLIGFVIRSSRRRDGEQRQQ